MSRSPTWIPSNARPRAQTLAEPRTGEAGGQPAPDLWHPSHQYGRCDPGPAGKNTGSIITGQVKVVEYQGDRLEIYLTAGGTDLIAMLDPRSTVKAGDTVRLHIENDQMHLFDTDTGQAIF